MNPQPDITSAAALIADPARAAMLLMLVDGRAHPAGELAYCAGVPLTHVEVQLAYRVEGDAPAIERRLRLAGLDAEQCARCAEIAEKTPVTRALKRGIAIETTLI